MTDLNHELDPELQAALRDLREDANVSDLETARVLSALRADGAFSGGAAGPRRADQRFRWAASVALFLGGAATGWGAGLLSPTTDSAASANTREAAGYLLLVYDTPESRTPQPSRQPANEEYAGWAREHPALVTSGYELAPERWAFPAASDTASNASPDGPVPTSALSGFFLLGDVTLQEALEESEGHPHLARGGRLELRPLSRR